METSRETAELCRISQLSLSENPTDQKIERVSSLNKSGYSSHGSQMETDNFSSDEKGAPRYMEDDEEYQSGTNIIRSGKNDFINIYNNTGTVIIDLGCGAEHKGGNLTERERTISRRPFPDSARSLASSMNIKRKKSAKLKSKRRLRQTLLPFPNRKSKMKVKPSSEKIKEVNISVDNNSGNIVIGDSAACHASTSEDPSRIRHLEGEQVVADGTEIIAVSPPKQMVVCVDRSIMKWLHQFYEITNQIYPLRDNGRWEEFYETVDKRIHFARQNGQFEEEIFMTIEKSTALSYQKKNEQSMEVVKQANDMITRTRGLQMKEFLTVMSHCQLAAIYRREQKMFKANHAVVIAGQNAEFVPSYLAKAYAMYERASNQAMYISIVSTQQPEREEYEKDTREDHRSCISLCEKLLSESDDIYLRRHHFCFLKLALMNLNCRNENARIQPVSEDSVREANECITRMQELYSGEMSEATNILLLTVQSDYKYRTGDYSTAMVFAEEALKISERRGFELEIKELQERLKLLEEHQHRRLANATEICELNS
ncbi:uncharacterized protein LOC116307681 [Actinia tenebrosa]|uniref:Uncharacterized protein LOC116307681 n=1 Tax=Actinia tenebrosa TaxID=6105 RepID=A0A6P8J7M2_ACTTE|nr:uncharacterized protein LOC116307681 [Actinia tenebrosa]